MCALNVAVVVDLNASWVGWQIKDLGHPFQQLLLRRGFRHLTAIGLARVEGGVIDQSPFLTALRNQNFNLMASLLGESFFN